MRGLIRISLKQLLKLFAGQMSVDRRRNVLQKQLVEHPLEVGLENDAQNGLFEVQQVRRIDPLPIPFVIEIKGRIDGPQWVYNVPLGVEEERSALFGGDGPLSVIREVGEQRLDDLAAIPVVFDHFRVVRRDEPEQNALKLREVGAERVTVRE